jgi:hypothetical protein
MPPAPRRAYAVWRWWTRSPRRARASLWVLARLHYRPALRSGSPVCHRAASDRVPTVMYFSSMPRPSWGRTLARLTAAAVGALIAAAPALLAQPAAPPPPASAEGTLQVVWGDPGEALAGTRPDARPLHRFFLERAGAPPWRSGSRPAPSMARRRCCWAGGSCSCNSAPARPGRRPRCARPRCAMPGSATSAARCPRGSADRWAGRGAARPAGGGHPLPVPRLDRRQLEVARRLRARLDRRHGVRGGVVRRGVARRARLHGHSRLRAVRPAAQSRRVPPERQRATSPGWPRTARAPPTRTSSSRSTGGWCSTSAPRSTAARGAAPGALSLDGQTRTYGMNWNASWAGLGTSIHELGHSLGLPHSSSTYGRVYDSRWDVMSAGAGCALRRLGQAAHGLPARRPPGGGPGRRAHGARRPLGPAAS